MSKELASLSEPGYSISERDLGKFGRLEQETITNEQLGMSAVVMRWGVQYSQEEIRTRLELEQPGIAVKLKDVRMFDRVFQASPAASLKERERLEIALAVKAIQDTVKAQGVTPESIEFFCLGCGSPMSPEYALLLARKAGLTRIQPQNILMFVGACNSGGMALDAATRRFRGMKGLVMGLEGFTRLLPSPSLKHADALSLLTFGDGLSCIYLEPGSTIHTFSPQTFDQIAQRGKGESATYTKQRVTMPHVVPDTKGALAAGGYYRDWLPDPDLWAQQVDSNFYVQMPIPPDLMLILMNGAKTGKAFEELSVPVLRGLAEWFRIRYNLPIDRVVTHVPSLSLLSLMAPRYQAVVPDGTRIENMVDDGNSSGATMLINFARQMQGMKPGEIVLVLSFGAGMSITAFMCVVGSAKSFSPIR